MVVLKRGDKVEHLPISAAQAAGRKTIDYTCVCCGEKFVSGRAKEEILCATCIELRRTLRSFEKRGLSKEEVLGRARKLLGGKGG